MPVWNNMLLAVFVRQQWRFGSCEERDLSSVKRKEVRQAAPAERNILGGAHMTQEYRIISKGVWTSKQCICLVTAVEFI